MTESNSQIDDIIRQDSATKKTPLNKADTANSRLIANAIHNTGVLIIVLGVIAGLLMLVILKDPNDFSSYSRDPHPLRWLYAIIVIASSIISALFMFATSVVINLLINIEKNTSR